MQVLEVTLRKDNVHFHEVIMQKQYIITAISTLLLLFTQNRLFITFK